MNIPVNPQLNSAGPASESSAKLTPMMAQYVEIKAANPDSLLFYRMGDFFELFFEDAVEASRALGITLTKRGKHLGEDIPMCGVPVRAADEYLRKLIALGFRVAVCEQLENPAEAKKRGNKSVVRRDVTRLVTAGTITEDELLDPSTANYLCALARLGGQDYAIAWIDISTGSFRVMQTSEKRLLADLARIDPRELVVSEPVFQDPELRAHFETLTMAVAPQPSVMFDSSTASHRLARFYGLKTLDGLGPFSKVEISAAAAVLAYVEKTQISERPALSRPTSESRQTTLFIDAATRANLELVKTLSGEKSGSLLTAINRTLTGAGARMIAERLMSPLVDPIKIAARHEDVTIFLHNTAMASAIRSIIGGGGDIMRAIQRISLNRGGPRDLGAVLAGLNKAMEIVGELDAQESLSVNIIQAKLSLSGVPKSLSHDLQAALSDELPPIKREGGFICSGHDTDLDEARSLRDESRQVIAGLQAQYAKQCGIKNLKIRHNNVLGYFIEVTALNSEAMTTDEAREIFIHRQTMANAMRFTTTELAELETRIANAANRALQIELAHFERLAHLVLEQSERLAALANALAELDVASALATLAEEQGYVRPQVDDSLALDITGGRHPVVEQMLRKQALEPFVANNCHLGPQDDDDWGKIWLLTGPNMGGKSTFLRQNALIVIMAQMGSFVPAGSAHIGVVDRLFSRVGAADDLARGRSTFMVEMVETAAILNQAETRSLVILDEIGRGTATFDGLSIAWAAIEHLHEVNRCRTLFATHYHELTSLSEPLSRMANVTMRVKEWEGDVVFLHEVVPGAADRSYGIQVARLAGLPDAVINRARDVLQQLEESDRKSPTTTLIDDLPLFSATPRQAARTQAQSPAVELLEKANIDEMTPRQALEYLYELKTMVDRKD